MINMITARRNNAAGYVQEGTPGFVFAQPQACQPSEQNIYPLYRYYNTGDGAYFYTTNFSELIPANGSGNGWKFEAIQGYTYSQKIAETAPLLRYYQSNHDDHFYTTDPGEGNNDDIKDIVRRSL
jgi:hypothetical protein